MRIEMKKKIVISILTIFSFVLITHAQQLVYENRYERSLSDLLTDFSEKFGVRFSFDMDTAGLTLPYADFRVRPYSLEETLNNIAAPFDYKCVKQNDTLYKLKYYEYARRTEEDGEKMLVHLLSLYPDKVSWEERKVCYVKKSGRYWISTD